MTIAAVMSTPTCLKDLNHVVRVQSMRPGSIERKWFGNPKLTTLDWTKYFWIRAVRPTKDHEKKIVVTLDPIANTVGEGLGEMPWLCEMQVLDAGNENFDAASIERYSGLIRDYAQMFYDQTRYTSDPVQALRKRQRLEKFWWRKLAYQLVISAYEANLV